MKIICGVDIGNSTTEVTIGKIDEINKCISYLSSYRVKTTGIKGTRENVVGIRVAVEAALKAANLNISKVDLVKINEASPVISESTMEVISETIITDSAMIGHNPETPGGEGIASGITINIQDLNTASTNKDYIVVVDSSFDYNKTALEINKYLNNGIEIRGAILKADEGVLVYNRLNTKIPIIDEVDNIEKVPLNMLAAIEVAKQGSTVKVLSNPYGIAGIFNFDANETKKITPIAKGLIGLRSGVVIKTPLGEVEEKKVKAGAIKIYGNTDSKEIDINFGADIIMNAVKEIGYIQDVEGENGTNISFMINSIKDSMSTLTELPKERIKIKDILAIDTTVPLLVKGGIANETYREKAVAIAAMVKTEKLPLLDIKNDLIKYFGVQVEITGVEAVMAAIGALTTRGTTIPIAVVDMGGGSTDVGYLDEIGKVKTTHLAGAGDLATMLINLELGLKDKDIAEEVKRHIVGKVESLYTIRLEDGTIKFYDSPLNPKFYGRVVVIRENDIIPIYQNISIEEVVRVRRKVKHDIFVKNIIRGLKEITPYGNLHAISNVVLVGGSALDFEIPDMVSLELSNYGIVSGFGNIRNSEGPRHAVSTGLVIQYIERL